MGSHTQPSGTSHRSLSPIHVNDAEYCKWIIAARLRPGRSCARCHTRNLLHMVIGAPLFDCDAIEDEPP